MNRLFRLLHRCVVQALPLALLAAAPALAQPTFTKAFSPDTIGPGSTSALTFVIDNSGSGTGAASLAFTDTLPAGVTLADPASPTTTCGGTLSAPDGGSTITLSGASVLAFSSCQVQVDVTSSVVGAHSNTSGDLTSTAGNSGPATADLTVSTGRLGFTKSFSPTTVQLGGDTVLTFTIDNSLGASSHVALSFSDTLPSGVVVADPVVVTGDCPSVGSGAVTATAGGPTLSYSAAGPLASGATCTISVEVHATGSGTPVNRSSELSSKTGIPTLLNGFAVAALQVSVDTLALDKDFTDDPVAPGGFGTLRFTLTNFSRSDSATGLTFTDDLDATLSGLVAVAPLPVDPCGAGSSLSGTSLLTLTNGSLGPAETCTFDVTIEIPPGASPGTYPNTTSSVSGDLGGAPTTGSPAADGLVVGYVPILTKTVTPDPAAAGSTVTVEFEITNPGDSTMSAISFVEPFEAFLPGSTPVLPGSNYCNGTGTSGLTDFSSTVTFSNISLAAGASCTFSLDLVTVQNTSSGEHTNTTSAIQGRIDGNTVYGAAATDTVTIVAAPRLTKRFIGDPVQGGDTVTLQFTLDHDASAPADATGISFTDDLSATLTGLTAIDTPIMDVCGTGSQISGTTNLSFTGGTLAPDESCTFSVTLQVPAGAASGTYPNTTSDVTGDVGGVTVTGLPAVDDLVVAGLSLTKVFTDDPAVAGGTVTLQFTLENDDQTFDATDITFADNLGAALSGLAYNGPTLTDICGMGSQLTGTTTLFFTGGNLAPGTFCTFSVVLDVPGGAAAGDYTNRTSSVAATVDATSILVAPAVDSLTIVDPLSIGKEFTDDPAIAGGTVTLQLTLTNAHPTEAATGVSFTDDLDAALTGLQVTGTPVSDCGGTVSGTSVLTLTGGTIAAASSCTITATLQIPAMTPSGTMAVNTTSSVTGTINGVGVTGDPASDTLLVEVASLSKAFDGPTTATGTAVLTFTIENLSSTARLSGLAFTDDLSAVIPGLVAIDTPQSAVCGGASTLSGTGLLTFSGGGLEPGTSCSFDVTVEVPPDAAAGTYPNTTSDLSASGVMVGAPGTDDLVIEPPPGFSKSFAPATTGVGVASTLTFTIDNGASSLAASGLDFTDNLPAGVTVTTPANASTTCTGGTLTGPPGSGTFSYTGGTVAAGASCTVSVDVVASSTGSFINTTGELTSSSGSSGTGSSTLTVRPAPTVTKEFSPAEVHLGHTTTVVITIDNSASPLPVTGIAFTDNLPSNFVVADPANASTTCTGGTLTATAGAGDFSYAGGSVAAGASCVVMVDVLAVAPGPTENTVVVTSSLGTSPAASAPIVVDASVVEVPTAGTWGLMMLGVLLAAGALWRLRI